jgi:hypothetical protein
MKIIDKYEALKNLMSKFILYLQLVTDAPRRPEVYAITGTELMSRNHKDARIIPPTSQNQGTIEKDLQNFVPNT